MKNLDFILDVGSSKICLFACTNYKSNPVIVCSSEQMYDGFADSEFFEPNEITDVVQKLMIDMLEDFMTIFKNSKKMIFTITTKFSL